MKIGSKRNRRGRPRVSTERFASGKPIKNSDPVVPPETLLKREGLAGKQMAMTSEAGRAPEILRMWGILTDRQVRTCEEYRRVVYVYRFRTGAPRNAAQIANISVLPDGLPDETSALRANRRDAMTQDERDSDDEKREHSAEVEMLAVLKIVNGVYPQALARSTLDMIAVEDYAPETWSVGIVAPIVLKTLKTALDNLADHFHIERDDEAA